ncbi:MAG: gliding motility protein GldN [Duncaniella sp.]|nr:gliding motility protein GldN [Duncaniella sp.]
MIRILFTIIALSIASAGFAQESSAGSVVRRRDNAPGQAAASPGVTARMQSRLGDNAPGSDIDDSELQWMRVIYRRLDLSKDANAPLYYPDEPIEGQDNLFRIIFAHMADGSLKGYEYLDGREIFTPEYQVKMRDVLDRFYIPYTDAKGSTEKNPRFAVEPSDVPAGEVQSYYMVERWEFDKRQNRMRRTVEAICPVLHRSGDFGGEDVRYPMFWVKYADLRPFLVTQNIFTSDDNNLATATYDDFFQLSLYDGEIYKTRNLKNKSLMQLHPDPDELAHAQDSIQRRLEGFEEKLWVPSLDELARRREAAAEAEAAALAAAEGADTPEASAASSSASKSVSSSRTRRGSSASKSSAKKPAKTPKAKKPKAVKSSSSSAARSVRNRKR